eukprot:CAMPEP_0197404902 /NCGR_PEP_ID=MMETSP1165-20131217/23577_1 /TAXON_ID=284809 /ORGANISM="Chrysocystis fragilis, Strain CCMP3189" /LENGTH=38 /DNA_ID= /DNA_START= /DNA_END= /DNA_ORIENTATION=
MWSTTPAGNIARTSSSSSLSVSSEAHRRRDVVRADRFV